MAMTPKERAAAEEALKADDEARKREQDMFEVEIGSEGNYARVPYAKGKAWLQKTFGIDLDDEPEAEEPDPKAAKDGGTVRFGRKIAAG
jgi:hypothetical protein